jgi:hypothetical protein
MDTGELVAGGAEGLRRIAELVKGKGIPVEGAYLIKTTADEGSAFWRLRLITNARSLQVIHAIVDLRREQKLPRIDPSVRVSGVLGDDTEASRIITYAQNAVERPVEIIDTPIDGLFVEYALVADWPPASDRVAA